MSINNSIKYFVKYVVSWQCFEQFVSLGYVRLAMQLYCSWGQRSLGFDRFLFLTTHICIVGSRQIE